MIPFILAAASTAAAAATAAAVPATKASAAATLSPDLQRQIQNLTSGNFVPKTPIAQNLPWLTHGLAGIFVILAILLVGLLAIQTTKQEGLSGTIGGRVEGLRGARRGPDQQLAYITTVIAVAFVFVATIVSLTGI